MFHTKDMGREIKELELIPSVISNFIIKVNSSLEDCTGTMYDYCQIYCAPSHITIYHFWLGWDSLGLYLFPGLVIKSHFHSKISFWDNTLCGYPSYRSYFIGTFTDLINFEYHFLKIHFFLTQCINSFFFIPKTLQLFFLFVINALYCGIQKIGLLILRCHS